MCHFSQTKSTPVRSATAHDGLNDWESFPVVSIRLSVSRGPVVILLHIPFHKRASRFTTAPELAVVIATSTRATTLCLVFIAICHIFPICV